MKRAILNENARPQPLTVARETDIAEGAWPEGGAAKEGTQVVGNGLYLPGWVGGSVVNFLADTGSGVSISSLEEMEAAGERTAEVLGPTVFSGGMGARMHGTSETGSHPGHVDRTLGLHRDRDWRGKGHPGQ